jgi:hypothetical protein
LDRRIVVTGPQGEEPSSFPATQLKDVGVEQGVADAVQ